MLGIWHGDEWMKRYLAPPFYCRVECGSPISSLDFASLTNGYFSMYFYENFDGLYVVQCGKSREKIGIKSRFFDFFGWSIKSVDFLPIFSQSKKSGLNRKSRD